MGHDSTKQMVSGRRLLRGAARTALLLVAASALSAHGTVAPLASQLMAQPLTHPNTVVPSSVAASASSVNVHGAFNGDAGAPTRQLTAEAPRTPTSSTSVGSTAKASFRPSPSHSGGLSPSNTVVTPLRRRIPSKPVGRWPVVDAATIAAAEELSGHLNPLVNIAPSPNFLGSGACTQNGATWSCANPCVNSLMLYPAVVNDTVCTSFVLGAINNARGIEHLRPMILPRNWYALTDAQQLFVVADLERVARGLPPYLGINAALSASAQHAAATTQDPSVAAGFTIGNDDEGYPAMGGAWSGGYSVLVADYLWMYSDGWGGSEATTSNVACTSNIAAACWAHRDELIGSDPGFNPGVGLTTSTCEMGVGFAIVNGSGSFVDLIEKPAATPPAMNFTWARNVAPYL